MAGVNEVSVHPAHKKNNNVVGLKSLAIGQS
jgi:hypothetical protein